MKCERRWEGQLLSCPLSSLNQLESFLPALFLFPLLILSEIWLSRAGPPSGHLATVRQASGRSYVSPWMAKKGRTWAWVEHLAETNERWFTVSESQAITEGGRGAWHHRAQDAERSNSSQGYGIQRLSSSDPTMLAELCPRKVPGPPQ